MSFFTNAGKVVRKIGLVAAVGALCAIALTVAQAPAASNLICSGSNVVAGVLATCPSPPTLLHPTIVTAHAEGIGSAHAEADCPAGQIAIGGGAAPYAYGTQGLTGSASQPSFYEPAERPFGWLGAAYADDHGQTTQVDVWAICVPGS